MPKYVSYSHCGGQLYQLIARHYSANLAAIYEMNDKEIDFEYEILF